MSHEENVRDQNINTHTIYARGTDALGRSWVIRSPEGNDAVSRIRFSVEPILTETGIILHEAKLTSIQAGGYSFTNQYTALVASDTRADITKPTGFDSRNVTNRYIQFDGDTWSMSNTRFFDILNLADATNSVFFMPLEFRSSAGEMLLTIDSNNITDFTEDATFSIQFMESLQIRYLGDRSGVTRTKQVIDESGFPAVVGGFIPMERFRSYGIDNNVTATSGMLFPTDGAPITMFSENPDNNDLTFDIGTGTALTGTNLGGMVLRNLIIRGENKTETLFDLTQVDSEPDSSLIFDNCRFTNFASLGTIIGFRDVIFNNCTFDIFDEGTAFTDCGVSFSSTNRWESRNTSGTIDISLYGTMTAFIITATQFTTAENSHALYIDPSLVIGQGNVTACPYVTPTGGSFFAAGSTDQTKEHWRFTANGDVPDSAIVGSFQFTADTTTTTILEQGSDGEITAFADAGGGLVTVTDAGHGQVNGNLVNIHDSTGSVYEGSYTIANVTASTYDITATYAGTATAIAEYGWTEIAGTATAGAALERFSFEDSPNRLTYLDAPPTKAYIAMDITATDGSSGKVFEVMAFRKPLGGIYDHFEDSRNTSEFDNRAKGIGWGATIEMAQGDEFKMMVRNTEGTDNITVIDNRMTILKA